MDITPKAMIGTVDYGGTAYKLYTAEGDSSDNIYIQNTWDIIGKGKYIRYSYLCDDVISLNGEKWALTSAQEPFTQSQFWYVKKAGENSSSASSQGVEASYQLIWRWWGSVGDFVGNRLGVLPSGGVLYASKAMAPEKGVYLNDEDNWFFIVNSACLDAYLQSLQTADPTQALS